MFWTMGVIQYLIFHMAPIRKFSVLDRNMKND